MLQFGNGRIEFPQTRNQQTDTKSSGLKAAETGYYVVFDHPKEGDLRVETQTLDGFMIRSYAIPMMQELNIPQVKAWGLDRKSDKKV